MSIRPTQMLSSNTTGALMFIHFMHMLQQREVLLCILVLALVYTSIFSNISKFRTSMRIPI